MKKAKIWFSILLIFGVLHSTITVLYNLPITPFIKKINNPINAYMEPLFTQTWTLFAPNPVSTNTQVEVKLSHEDNQETEWISFSDTILDQSQDSFFTHYQFYADALTQMDNDLKSASISIINNLEKTGEKELLEELDDKNFFKKHGSQYVNDLVKTKDVEHFLKNNVSANSLYGMIYDYYNAQFPNISDMQVRVISEIFPEYGESEETKYHFFYLPKLKTDQLISKKPEDGGE